MPKPCVVTRHCRWENGYFFNFSEIFLTFLKLKKSRSCTYGARINTVRLLDENKHGSATFQPWPEPAFPSELSKWAILIASAPKREQYLTRPGSFKQSIDKKSQTHDCWEALRYWSVNDKWELHRVKNYTVYWLQVELLFGLCTLEVF